MTDRPLDPRREKLVGLLYGELTPEEEQAIRREIDADAELRKDWEEIAGTRAILQGWEVAQESPSFLFLDEEEPVRRPKPEGAFARFRRKLGSTTVAPWAVATAALVVAVLSVGGLRVVRNDDGLTLRFGQSEAPQLASEGMRLEDPPSPTGGSPSHVLTVQDLMTNPELTPYMTREEFEAYAAGMMHTISALLNEYARDRDEGVGVALTELVGTLERGRQDDYRELRSRIEAVRADLAEEQLRSNLRVGENDQPGLMAPTSHSPADGLEGDQK